jgi:GMP synthase (glutamine-hydrolysing)
MRTALICQHEAGDDLRKWRPLLRALGVRPRFCDFSRRPGARPTLHGIDGLVLLGGAMDVHEAPARPHLGWEMELVRRAAGRIPLLGLCLGAQLVAEALGGRVRKSARPEIGWHPLRLTAAGRRDPAFRGLARGGRAFQWHEYEFLPPPGAASLASSPRGRHQAFRLGAKTLAVQFHPEIDRPTIDRWLAEASTLPPSRKEAIRAQTPALMPGSAALGRAVWKAFARAL